jgi:tetratricopeptide (TPR) repeat protein
MGETRMLNREKIITASAVWLMLILGMGFVWAGEGDVKNAPAVTVDLIQANTSQQARSPFMTGGESKNRCTIIYASDSMTALAGNNEDGVNLFPIIWFQPAEDGKFGYMCFGFQSGWPRVEGLQWEGAVNEKGLFYDFATTEEVKVPRDPNKPDSWGLSGKMIMECRTVDEAIKLFSKYNFKDGVWKGHYLIGDRFGNSAIIEPLTFIRKSRKYQVATNFLQSKTEPETSDGIRYHLASDLFEKSDIISVDLFRRILDDTHAEDYGGSYNVTLYSYIHDLKSGDVYIYNFHDYNTVVKLNIHEELKKGPHTYLISSLFPEETYAEHQYKATRLSVMLLEKALKSGVTGEEGAIAFYKAVNSSEDTLVNYRISEEYLEAVGYALLQYNKNDEAIELFNFIVEEFPQSASAYDSRGEAYMKAGNNELAIENYMKSLELNPDNENAKKMLEKLQK